MRPLLFFFPFVVPGEKKWYNIHINTDTHIHQKPRRNIMTERKMVNLTLTVTPEERKALKQLALDRDTTVSALLRQWLKENTEKEKKNGKR